MIPARGESYEFKVYKRKPNSSYEWEDAPCCTFKGRPASQTEVKTYRIQKGVHSNTDSTFILATNLPEEVKPEDKVVFLGKEWQVKNIGYYFESALIVNANILSEEQIIQRCPKGVALQ